MAESEGVDVVRFKRRRGDNDAGKIRKSLKRRADGKMTVPSPETNKSALEKFKHVLNDIGEHEL